MKMTDFAVAFFGFVMFEVCLCRFHAEEIAQSQADSASKTNMHKLTTCRPRSHQEDSLNKIKGES